MNTGSWFLKISFKQRIWLFSTLAGILAIITVGILLDSPDELKKTTNFNINMSIRNSAPPTWSYRQRPCQGT